MNTPGVNSPQLCLCVLPLNININSNTFLFVLGVHLREIPLGPFLNLIERNKSLQEAAYIVNPNFNDAKGSVFLKDDGELLYEADFFANTIINEPLDFEYKVKDYTYNHPFSKTFNDFTF